MTSNINSLVGEDLEQFTQVASSTRRVYESLTRPGQNLVSNEDSQLMMMRTNYTAAISRSVGSDFYRYVAVLLRIDRSAPPPPHLIDDTLLVQLIEQHECGPSRPQTLEVNCDQTLRRLVEEAQHRKLEFRMPASLVGSDGYALLPKDYQTPPQSDGSSSYGDVPGEPAPKGTPTDYQPAPVKYDELPPDIEYGTLPPDVRSSAPLHSTEQLDPFDVDLRHVVVPDAVDVIDTLAALATLGRGLHVRRSRAQAPERGLYARGRSFAAGDLVTEYAGARYSYHRADWLRRRVERSHMQTLRAGVWIVVGEDTEVRGAGGGSHARSTLDVCASIRSGREIACADAVANCELVVLTDAENASAPEDEYEAASAHIVLVALRPIADGEEILLDLVRLGHYTGATRA